MVLGSLAFLFESLLTIWLDKNTCESRALSNLSRKGTPDNSNEATVSRNIVAKKQQHGPSDYELKRQANIEENRKLLDELGLSKGGSSAIVGKSSTRKKKGEKEER
jgi:hypothetical protein